MSGQLELWHMASWASAAGFLRTCPGCTLCSSIFPALQDAHSQTVCPIKVCPQPRAAGPLRVLQRWGSSRASRWSSVTRRCVGATDRALPLAINGAREAGTGHGISDSCGVQVVAATIGLLAGCPHVQVLACPLAAAARAHPQPALVHRAKLPPAAVTAGRHSSTKPIFHTLAESLHVL